MKVRQIAVACFLLSQVCAARAGCAPLPDLHESIEEQIAQCSAGMWMLAGPGGQVRSEQRAAAYYVRGLLYHLAGKYDLAVADYTTAIGWQSDLEDAVEARGDAYEDMGQHDKASADYAKAGSMRADGRQALAQRCWTRAVRGRPLDRALADCDAALKLGADEGDTLDSRCLVYFKMNNYAAAIADCGKVEAMRRRAASSLYVGGVAKLRSGDAAGGNADIAAALDADFRIADKYALFGVTH